MKLYIQWLSMSWSEHSTLVNNLWIMISNVQMKVCINQILAVIVIANNLSMEEIHSNE